LVASVRANTTIDGTIKESVRAKLRMIVDRSLRKHGYPPDKQETAAPSVLAQPELLCASHGRALRRRGRVESREWSSMRKSLPVWHATGWPSVLACGAIHA
jgi:hypothetical protein